MKMDLDSVFHTRKRELVCIVFWLAGILCTLLKGHLSIKRNWICSLGLSGSFHMVAKCTLTLLRTLDEIYCKLCPTYFMKCKYHVSYSWENLLICHIYNRPIGVVWLRWFYKMNLVHTTLCGFYVFDFFKSLFAREVFHFWTYGKSIQSAFLITKERHIYTCEAHYFVHWSKLVMLVLSSWKYICPFKI